MSHIYALHDHDEKLKKRGCFAIDHCKAKEYNDMGYGIFFSVNSFTGGVRREENLKKLNAWFIDIDEGSKPDQFKKIMEFRTRPSMIVETKNGHHVYWGCKEQPTIEDYNNTLERLVKYFNADKNAKGVTRILRLPKYNHLKNKNAPFVIKELYKKETYYTTEQMHEFLPVIEKPTPRPVSDIPAGEFWDKANKLDVRKAFTTLSGTSAVNNDTLETEGRNIIVNGQKLKSCWIDKDEKIGSHSNGGPTIVNWIDWYHNDMAKTAEILEEYFPEIKDKVVDFQFVEKIEQLEKKVFAKLPRLDGIGNDLFHELYDKAPIPRTQFAFQNTMVLLSLLCANKWTYKGTGLNIYTYSIAPSSSGKDYPFKRAQRILREAGLLDLLGPASFTSETSLLRYLEGFRIRGCFVNEAEKVLKLMSNVRTNLGVIESLTDLFDCVGHETGGKGIINSKNELEKFGKIFSPHLCVSMASTVEAFSTYATKGMFDTGLLSRFNLFFEDRERMQKPVDIYNPPLGCGLVDNIKKIFENDRPTYEGDMPLEIIPALTDKASAKQHYIDMFYQVQKDIKDFKDSAFKGALNRKLLFCHKFTGLHHFMNDPFDCAKKEISKKSIDWGYNCATSIIINTFNHLDTRVAENDIVREENRVINFVSSHPYCTKKEISNACRNIQRRRRNDILIDLLERKVLTHTINKKWCVAHKV